MALRASAASALVRQTRSRLATATRTALATVSIRLTMGGMSSPEGGLSLPRWTHPRHSNPEARSHPRRPDWELHTWDQASSPWSDLGLPATPGGIQGQRQGQPPGQRSRPVPAWARARVRAYHRANPRQSGPGDPLMPRALTSTLRVSRALEVRTRTPGGGSLGVGARARAAAGGGGRGRRPDHSSHRQKRLPYPVSPAGSQVAATSVPPAKGRGRARRSAGSRLAVTKVRTARARGRRHSEAAAGAPGG